MCKRQPQYKLEAISSPIASSQVASTDASAFANVLVKNDIVFCLYCPFDNRKTITMFFKKNGASRKACITAARLTCSGRGCVSCERAASPSKSSVVGSTSTCKTFAAGSALSDAASALQRCCSTYCTHCTSVDGEPS